jgi:hypothetical protein
MTQLRFSFAVLLLSVPPRWSNATSIPSFVVSDIDNQTSIVDDESTSISWGYYEDGDRHPKYYATHTATGSELTFYADEETLDYSMIHFYKNIPLPQEQLLPTCNNVLDRAPRTFCFSTKWSYGVADSSADPTDPATAFDQPTGFNGVGWDAKIQAIEFSASRWECNLRNEIALQWCVVCPHLNANGENDWHTGSPVWRYWDNGWTAIPDDCGITAELSQLAHAPVEHELELCGIIDGNDTKYTTFTINGNTIDLHSCMPDPVDTTSSDRPSSLLALAIQLDATSKNYAFRVQVDDMKLEYLGSANGRRTTVKGRGRNIFNKK